MSGQKRACQDNLGICNKTKQKVQDESIKCMNNGGKCQNLTGTY